MNEKKYGTKKPHTLEEIDKMAGVGSTDWSYYEEEYVDDMITHIRESEAEIDLMRKALQEIEEHAKFLIAHGVNPRQVQQIHSLSYHAQDPQNRHPLPVEPFPE